jgi:hypothetical protein
VVCWGGALQVADRFLYQAFEEGLPSVLWVIQLDPRGASSLVHRCKQARAQALAVVSTADAFPNTTPSVGHWSDCFYVGWFDHWLGQ